MFSKRSVNIWTFDTINPHDKYNTCTSQYYRRRIHYFSLNSLYFFFLRFSHFHSRSLLYAGKLRKLRNISKPLRIFVVNTVTASQPPKHRKKTNAASPSACCVRLFLTGEGLLLDRLELVFADTAQRAHPIFGNILERRSCGNTSVRVTHGRIVNPFADRATILFHTLILLNSICFEQM